MKDRREVIRYYEDIPLEEHILVMSFVRTLKIRNISINGLAFYSPMYPKGDVIKITLTFPNILQIFEENILILSDEHEPFCRGKFVDPSKEFMETLTEYMEKLL